MDPDGGMYAALDDWITKLGATPEEALDEFVFRRSSGNCAMRTATLSAGLT
jgi:hypothetical protein